MLLRILSSLDTNISSTLTNNVLVDWWSILFNNNSWKGEGLLLRAYHGKNGHSFQECQALDVKHAKHKLPSMPDFPLVFRSALSQTRCFPVGSCQLIFCSVTHLWLFSWFVIWSYCILEGIELLCFRRRQLRLAQNFWTFGHGMGISRGMRWSKGCERYKGFGCYAPMVEGW
jgi:hypothetical protein